MKILIIGGSGTLSYSAAKVFEAEGHEVYALNRQGKSAEGVTVISADINDAERVKEFTSVHYFDAVVDFISFVPSHIERAYNYFSKNCRQYVFISSASVYENSATSSVITEKTNLSNPYASYSRDKIDCEKRLKELKEDWCYTIVRPSHTYNDFCLPVDVHGEKGFYEVFYRIKNELPVILHGDGTSFWTVTHADDLAKGILSLIGNPKAFYEDFTITSDDYMTWNELYRIVADALGKKLNPIYVSSQLLCELSKLDYTGSLIGDKSNNKIFDCSKIKEISPDFECKIGFREVVGKIIQNIEADRSLHIRDYDFAEFCDKIAEQYQIIKNNF